MKNKDHTPYATVLKCQCCGTRFLFRRGSRPDAHMPRFCSSCKRDSVIKERKEREAAESKKRQEQRDAEKKIFAEKLKHYRTVDLNDIKTNEDNTVFILGNGFDMMHGANSSYYGFRDSMGKNNELRSALETLLTSEDIWSDFESALGKFNMRMMAGNYTVDMLLDALGAYDEEAGQAEFFIAVESAARPIVTITRRLPAAFRKWVEGLKPGTDDRPLERIFCNGRVLCFNYTEFPETLYNISDNRVCYVHGCRKNKNEPLILGHMTGSNEDVYAFEDRSMPTKNRYKQGMITIAQQFIRELIAQCDESLTKNCDDIIAAKENFFSSLGDVENIVVIGHSMSAVDIPYFQKIIENTDEKNTKWYIGCHSLKDLLNMEKMQNSLGIRPDNISLFRTDVIETRPNSNQVFSYEDLPVYWKKTCGVSPNGNWRITDENGLMRIWDKNDNSVFDIWLSQHIARVVFSQNEDILLVATKGYNSGVFLFGRIGEQWTFRNELENAPGQSLISARLCHVYLSDDSVSFVYKKRIRAFSLVDGRMILNSAINDTQGCAYKGEDIKEQLSYR